MPIETQPSTVTIAHSPDSDDAFMFYGLATNKLDTGSLNFKHLLKDIQTLNEEAMRGTYDVTGASISDNYGPVVVSLEAARPEDIATFKIAIPGKLTSAFLALRIFNPDFEFVVVPFDKIIDAVKDGSCDAGLLIHEGQLFYESIGLHKVLDLGEWWHQRTGLPLPMGGNVIRRDLGPELIREISELLRESINYSLEHREDALQYAMQFAREMDPALADRFVAMWVNELTLDYTDRGREAVHRLLEEGFEKGIIPNRVAVEFVGG